jgi:predicted  nucleic acid-binding Zn-ribbon protein
MSQAQSISNLCNQRARDISFKLRDINNVEKTLKIGEETYTETPGKKMPGDVIDLLNEKAKLHATQSFLMENIKAKEESLNEIRNRYFEYKVEAPVRGDLEAPALQSQVDETWGWNQLSTAEYNEYLESEAFASHIGQFIHKGGRLDFLRSELPTIKTLEWIEVEAGKKTPLKVSIHHTQDELADLHEKLAEIHRKHEQRVNYFKAKVKNMVTSENARIAKENANAEAICNEKNQKVIDTYNKEREEWQANYRKASHIFEEERQKEIEAVAALRIAVDPRFQPTIDMFLKNVTE